MEQEDEEEEVQPPPFHGQMLMNLSVWQADWLAGWKRGRGWLGSTSL